MSAPGQAKGCVCGHRTPVEDEGGVYCDFCEEAIYADRQPLDDPASRLAADVAISDLHASTVDSKDRSIEILTGVVKSLRAELADVKVALAALSDERRETVIGTQQAAALVGRRQNWVKLHAEELGGWKDPISGYWWFYPSRVLAATGAPTPEGER